MNWMYNDGGRSKYFKATSVGDCVVRAIAIAKDMDYKEVYDTIKHIVGYTPRNGVYKKDTNKVMKHFGGVWVSCSGIGAKKKVHLKSAEMPLQGRLIAQVSKHITCVIDGVIHDTYDPSRGGKRMVYGYWKF